MFTLFILLLKFNIFSGDFPYFISLFFHFIHIEPIDRTIFSWWQIPIIIIITIIILSIMLISHFPIIPTTINILNILAMILIINSSNIFDISLFHNIFLVDNIFLIDINISSLHISLIPHIFLLLPAILCRFVYICVHIVLDVIGIVGCILSMLLVVILEVMILGWW